MLLTLFQILWLLQPAPSAGGGGGGGGGGAAAGGGGGGGGGTPQGCYTQVGLLAVMVLVFYFLLIRPQQKREREREAMLKALKKGTVVRTSGGIRGEITDMTERDVTLLISDRTKINVLRSNIAGVDGADEGGKSEGSGKATSEKGGEKKS